MDKFRTFKSLLRMQDGWKDEEVIIMLFHSLFLDSNFVLDESIRELVPTKFENENKKESSQIEITADGYMKCTIQKEGKEETYISKILIPPKWKDSASHYSFSYKHARVDIRLQMNFSKSGDMLTVILKETGTTSNAINYIIPISEFVDGKNGLIVAEQIERTCKLNDLESIFMNQLIRKMKFVGISRDTDTTSNKNSTSGCDLPHPHSRIATTRCAMGIQAKEEFGLDPLGRIQGEERVCGDIKLPDPIYLSDIFKNDIFDDKNPSIGPNMFQDIRRPNIQNPNILKPDGLLIGPNHQIFNSGKMKYDPIGPFGVEPNSDRKFDFNNNFPF